MWRSTLAELVATLLFVFIGAGSVVVTGSLTDGELTAARLVAVAMANGLAVAAMVYAAANISGGHINPAVTLAAIVTRNIGPVNGLMFIGAQVVGAIIGALLIVATISGAIDANVGAHALGAGVSVGQGLLMEIVVTFALVFVVFATAIDPKGMGKLAPLAIGLTVLVVHLVAVPVSGASMNPARSLGPALVAGAWHAHWVYWVGPLVGGVLAGVLYQYAFIKRQS